jgi:hypothetical protein
MGVLSKCTIVRAIGGTAYRLRATEQPAVGPEDTLIAMLKHRKKRLYSMPVKLPIEIRKTDPYP